LERALSMALAIDCLGYMPNDWDYGGARRILGGGSAEGKSYHDHFTSKSLTISHRLSVAFSAPMLEISDPHDRNCEHDNTIDVLAFSASGALHLHTGLAETLRERLYDGGWLAGAGVVRFGKGEERENDLGTHYAGSCYPNRL
jgi:hypothetical protein